MFEYITTAILELSCGLIQLSKGQAQDRLGCLAAVKGREGVYEILSPVQFKAGERIGLDNPDKVTLLRVDPTPETLEAMAAIEEERIQALADEKAQEILDEKAMFDLVMAVEQAMADGLVTATGAPTVEALEEILNQDVTAAQRDAAWEQLKKEQTDA